MGIWINFIRWQQKGAVVFAFLMGTLLTIDDWSVTREDIVFEEK
jgi:hypothetical protein